MGESKVKRENYITIQGFMLTDLKLKGNELLLYAIIYGFSQAENQVFTGSLQYLADWTNSSKQGVMKCLKSLLGKELIVKNENIINGVKFCEYYATKFNGVCNKVEQGMQQSLTGGIKQSLPNNTSTDNKRNIYNEIIEFYNKVCVSLSQVQKITDSRKRAIKARLNAYTVDEIKEAFKKAESSEFLTGKNNRNWRADFDWIMKDGNLAKILEGKYECSTTKKQEEKFDLRARGIGTWIGYGDDDDE